MVLFDVNNMKVFILSLILFWAEQETIEKKSILDKHQFRNLPYLLNSKRQFN